MPSVFLLIILCFSVLLHGDYAVLFCVVGVALCCFRFHGVIVCCFTLFSFAWHCSVSLTTKLFSLVLIDHFGCYYFKWKHQQTHIMQNVGYVRQQKLPAKRTRNMGLYWQFSAGYRRPCIYRKSSVRAHLLLRRYVLLLQVPVWDSLSQWFPDILNTLSAQVASWAWMCFQLPFFHVAYFYEPVVIQQDIAIKKATNLCGFILYSRHVCPKS
jgi:hypothetical protein